MQFFNIESINLIVIFFVPGFISIKIYDLLVSSKERDFSKSVLEVVSYSCLNFAFLFWILTLFNLPEFSNNHPILFFSGYLIFLPIIWPILLKKILFSNFLKGKIIHQTPKSWDFCFNTNEPMWVLVHLKSGKMIGGLFGKESFASSFPNSQDLYLEAVWKIDNKGLFKEEVPQTRGLLINSSEIEFLEFYRTVEKRSDKDGKRKS